MDLILEIDGEVLQPLKLSLDDVHQYPAYTTTTKLTSHDYSVDTTFTGARLWDILQTAGFKYNSTDQRRVIARASDAFRCRLRWYEIEPAMSEHLILVAYEQNGKILPVRDGPLRLIVSGDERGLRYLHGLKLLTVLDKGEDEE